MTSIDQTSSQLYQQLPVSKGNLAKNYYHISTWLEVYKLDSDT